MFITPNFVFLALPKTGTTFTRQVLTKLYSKYSQDYKILKMPSLAGKYKHIENNNMNVHGRYDQIPSEHIQKPVFSIIRNPFELYISHYEFRSWQRRPPGNLTCILKDFPNFPDITFKEFVHLVNNRKLLQGIYPPFPFFEKLGNLSHLFIQFFCKNPENILKELDPESVERKSYIEDLTSVTFLKNETLREDLYNFLLTQEFSKHDLAFIKSKEKANQSKRSSFNNYYDDDLLHYILEREKILFKLFPEYTANI